MAVVTPVGRRAVSGSADRTLRVWDLESGQSYVRSQKKRLRSPP
jgi:WD40 repeat protein